MASPEVDCLSDTESFSETMSVIEDMLPQFVLSRISSWELEPDMVSEMNRNCV